MAEELALLERRRNGAFYAYGTQRIFERRAARYRFGRILIEYLGIAVPLAVGGVVMAFGTDSSKALHWILPIAGLLALAQLLISLWAITARWSERYEQALDSVRAAARLFNSWEALRHARGSDLADGVAALEAQDAEQQHKDLGQMVTEKEKRFGYRETLLYFGLPCNACGKVPASSKPTSCRQCGSY